jgi:hypothetical protein
LNTVLYFSGLVGFWQIPIRTYHSRPYCNKYYHLLIFLSGYKKWRKQIFILWRRHQMYCRSICNNFRQYILEYSGNK